MVVSIGKALIRHLKSRWSCPLIGAPDQHMIIDRERSNNNFILLSSILIQFNWTWSNCLANICAWWFRFRHFQSLTQIIQNYWLKGETFQNMRRVLKLSISTDIRTKHLVFDSKYAKIFENLKKKSDSNYWSLKWITL